MGKYLKAATNNLMLFKKTTPMEDQYNQIKGQHPDKIILFRLGDFFEIFGEDAVLSAKILQIQLTSRSKGKANALPMCGVPAHSIENYIHKLINAGKRLVICDQVGGLTDKGLMKRKVVQIITPGTFFNDSILASDELNYIACLNLNEKTNKFGIALCDISTGSFLFEDVDISYGSQASDESTFNELSTGAQRLLDIYAIYQPSELLVIKQKSVKGKKVLDHILQKITQNYHGGKQDFLQWCPEKYNDAQSSWHSISDHYKIGASTSFDLDLNDACLISLGALLRYLKETQFTNLDHIEIPRPVLNPSCMKLDEATLCNLEIFNNNQNSSEYSIFRLMNKTSTPMGARALKFLMKNPFIDQGIIEDRLDVVAELIAKSAVASDITNILKSVGDLERFVSRLSLPNMSVLYLIRLKKGLQKLPLLHKILQKLTTKKMQSLTKEFDSLEDIKEKLALFLVDEPDFKIKGGNCIKAGVSQELDEKRRITGDIKRHILNLEKIERDKTGIHNLKIGYNRVFGYYIEISKLVKREIPENYIRKQTLTNAERFATLELQELEQKIIQAQSDILSLEEHFYNQLCQSIRKHTSRFKQSARLIGELDVFLSLAKVAEINDYCRAKFIDDKVAKLSIKKGRHPVLEQAMKRKKFISNDLLMQSEDRQTLIITGPNMGGKSTFMRQAALICYMAQIGSYVPASEVEMTVFDRVFTRVGAFDNLGRGQSTFMVEMAEMSLIINQASAKSLIIIDELGRGTSTFDGIGIAWAVVEYLNELGALTLFATHYHELTKLKTVDNRIHNCHVSVREGQDGLVFLHKILPGATDKSYGIQVAELAGMPKDVLRKAKQVYYRFEQREMSLLDENIDEYTQNTGTFKEDENEEKKYTNHKEMVSYYKEITDLDLDRMSPRDCFDFLQKLTNNIEN
ncbi:MAG: DNA mismatch repair protein MutS [SAR324 cluster bacterium]|nr:DNA mismatch repair protein MutS [SAR324 cluster bacterium]